MPNMEANEGNLVSVEFFNALRVKVREGKGVVGDPVRVVTYVFDTPNTQMDVLDRGTIRETQFRDSVLVARHDPCAPREREQIWAAYREARRTNSAVAPETRVDGWDRLRDALRKITGWSCPEHEFPVSDCPGCADTED